MFWTLLVWHTGGHGGIIPDGDAMVEPPGGEGVRSVFARRFRFLRRVRGGTRSRSTFDRDISGPQTSLAGHGVLEHEHMGARLPHARYHWQQNYRYEPQRPHYESSKNTSYLCLNRRYYQRKWKQGCILDCIAKRVVLICRVPSPSKGWISALNSDWSHPGTDALQ